MKQKKKLKKPSELLELYSKDLSKGLEEKLSPSAFELSLSFRSPKVAYISGFIIFRNGWILEFDEIIRQESNKVVILKYRYHVMDKNKQLILRYDNVPHFPKIKTHPHHKHLPGKVIESKVPNLLEVVREIELKILKQI